MRNLKRALSLVMAAAMLIGMMVISASAAGKDFTDKDEIQHTEAVETMVALNVISGKEDGSYFDPTGTLTRAEMAKIVAYVMNGGVEPNIGTKLVPTYSDIDNHWAEAYIEYCTSMGIINGDGAGKFNPNGTLTASQTAKMFLTAMGYNAEVFGLVGNDWETNTNRYANEAGLYDELGGVGVSQPISRDDAAQMAYNAIQAKLMERTWQQNQTTGQITEGYTLSETKTLLSERFGGKIFIGTFDGNSDTISSSIRDGEIQVTGYLTTDTIINTGNTQNQTQPRAAVFPSDLDISNIGEEVKVIFKDGTSGRSGTPDRNDTIYGVFNTGATQVINAVKADIGDQFSNEAKLSIDGVNYDTNTNGVIVVTNYTNTSNANRTSSTDGTKSPEKNSSLTTALKAANGDTIKFVCDDSGKIDRAYVVNTVISTVTAVNDEKITLSRIGTLTIADNDVYENPARGDVVTVTTLYNADATDETAFSTVEKAEVVSGTVNSYKDTESVTVDGTAYKLYNKGLPLTSIPGQTDVISAFNDNHIGEDFNLYLVNGYVGAAVQTSESANNYSLVLARNSGSAGAAFNALELQVMDAEGVVEYITVSEDSAEGGATAYNPGDIIVYTGSADDAVVTIVGEYNYVAGSYNDNTKTFNGKVTASNCVLFAETSAVDIDSTSNATGVSGATYKVYNIRDLDSFPADRAVAVTDDNGRVVAVFADLDNTPAGASSTTVYGIVTTYVGRVSVGDDRYYEYTVASNDETYTAYLANTGVIAKGDLVYFDPVSDNVYNASTMHKVAPSASIDAGYIKEYSEADGTLTYYTAKTIEDGEYVGVESTQTILALDDDCVIVYVDADGDAAGSEIGLNPFDGVTGHKNVVVVTKVVDNARVIVAIYVETSNEADILAVSDKGALSSPNAFDVATELNENGTAIVSGTFAGGNLNAEGKNLTFKGATISGNTTVRGGTTLDGAVTVAENMTLTAQQIDITGNGALTLNGNVQYMVLTAEEGAEIKTAKADFRFTSDVYIDTDTKTINNIPVNGEYGLINTLLTAAANGLGEWTRLEA